MADAAQNLESAEEAREASGAEGSGVESPKLDLGAFWAERTKGADAQLSEEAQHWVAQGTKLTERYKTTITPLELAAAEAALKEAQTAAADMKAKGELDIKGLVDTLGALKTPILLRQDKIIHPAEAHVIDSQDAVKVEADLGDVIPDRAEVKHDVLAEETTPAPDKPKDYSGFSLPELQKEYDRLFAAVEADLKAHPEKLKPYRKALKTGVLPNDPEAEKSELNNVYREIQARRAGKQPSAAPVKTVATTPEPMPASASVPDVIAARAYEASSEKDFGAVVSKYETMFEGAHTEGDLRGLITTYENRTAEDLLTDAEAAGILAKEDIRAVIKGGKIEDFKYAAIAYLTKLLEQTKSSVKPVAPVEAVIAAPKAKAKSKPKAEVAPPAPLAEPAPVPAAVAETSAAKKEFPKLEPVDAMLAEAVKEATRALPNVPKIAKPIVPPREKVLGASEDFFSLQQKVMPKQVKERIASMTSREQAAEYVQGLRKTLTGLESDAGVHAEVMGNRIGFFKTDIEAMTDEDLEKNRAQFQALYAEAVRIAEGEIAKRNEKADAKPAEAPKKTEAVVEQAAEASPIDVSKAVEAYLASAVEPIQQRALLKRVKPGKLSANAFLKDMTSFGIISEDAAKQLIQDGPAVARLIEQVSTDLAFRAGAPKKKE